MESWLAKFSYRGTSLDRQTTSLGYFCCFIVKAYKISFYQSISRPNGTPYERFYRRPTLSACALRNRAAVNRDAPDIISITAFRTMQIFCRDENEKRRQISVCFFCARTCGLKDRLPKEVSKHLKTHRFKSNAVD